MVRILEKRLRIEPKAEPTVSLESTFRCYFTTWRATKVGLHFHGCCALGNLIRRGGRH